MTLTFLKKKKKTYDDRFFSGSKHIGSGCLTMHHQFPCRNATMIVTENKKKRRLCAAAQRLNSPRKFISSKHASSPVKFNFLP